MLTEEVDSCQEESEAISTGVDKVDEWMSSLDADLFGVRTDQNPTIQSSEVCKMTHLCQGHGRK